MNRWKKLRILLLATTCGGALFVLGKSIFHSVRGVPTFVLPVTVPLPAWQPLTSSPLVDKTTEDSNFLSGRHYRYIQNGVPLDIEMHYLVNLVNIETRYLVNTNGDIPAIIKNYSSPSSSRPSLIIRQRKGIGFYSLFSERGRAHLSACINTYGVSTATSEQFWQSPSTYDLLSNHLLPWLSVQENLRLGDGRCLWANLSVPLTSSSPEEAYLSLEKTWVPWHKWWRYQLLKF